MAHCWFLLFNGGLFEWLFGSGKGLLGYMSGFLEAFFIFLVEFGFAADEGEKVSG